MQVNIIDLITDKQYRYKSLVRSACGTMAKLDKCMPLWVSLSECMCRTHGLCSYTHMTVIGMWLSVAKPQATEYYTKIYIQIHSPGTVGLAS